MDFLSQTGRQWMAQWQHAPAAPRWVLGILLVLGGMAAAAAISWPRSELREVLFDGVEFSRSELTAMEAAFGKAQLNDARIVGRTIEVPQHTKHLYLKALHDHQATPATFFSYSQRSLASDSPFTSPRQRDALTKLAKEQELALMLRKIAGIEEASVQFEDVDLGGFPRRKQRQATAAVRAAEGRTLERHVVRAIRATLMNTLGIADAQAVTVLDLNAGVAFTGDDSQHDAADVTSQRVAHRERAEPAEFAVDPAALPVAQVDDRTTSESTDDAPPSFVAARIPEPSPAAAPVRAARRNPHIQQAYALEAPSDELTPRRTPEEALSAPAPGEPSRGMVPPSGDWRQAGWQALPSAKWLLHWFRDNGVTFSVAGGGVAAMIALARRLRRTRARVRQARSVLRTRHSVGDQRMAATGTAEPDAGDERLGDPRRQLNQQVQDDVDSAAATLRQWLSNAA